MAEALNSVAKSVINNFGFVTLLIVIIAVWCYVFYRIENNKAVASEGKKNYLAKIERLELSLCVLIGSGILLFYYPGFVYQRWGGSALAVSILKIVVMVVTIQVIGYVTLHLSDLALLVFVMSVIQYYMQFKVFNKSILFFSTWFLLCILVKRRYGRIQVLALQTLISFLSAILSYYLFDFVFQNGVREMYYFYSNRWELSNVQKILFLSIVTLVFIAIFAGGLLITKKLLDMYIENIRTFSEKYKEIGRYLLLMPLFFGLVLLLLDLFQYERMYFLNNREFLVTAVCFVFFIGIQIFYIRLLMQTVRLKEHLQFQELEKESIESYQQDMVRNMKEIREMKHDLKNVFLTMGGYVARSNDEELKAYYYENIAPFAGNEIRKNDLYVSLQEIANESLRAFLYYKYLEIQNYHQEFQLMTFSDQSFLPYVTNTSDIIRILGIFIDNAREECAHIEEGSVILIIKEKEGELQISVKNTVRKSVLQSGIHVGTTSKGLGRGNGLEIVGKIIKKHDDILWNSYFKEEMFVQSINMKRRIKSQ